MNQRTPIRDHVCPTLDGEPDRNTYDTPEKMRKIIAMARFDDALIHNVFAMSEYAGLSGEDKYTALAFHALLQLERMREQLIKQINCTPVRTLILIPDPGA